MVEHEGFRQMIHILNPGYTLPLRTHFTKLMERKYEQTFQAVRSDIKATQSKIALTTYVWTSVPTEAYLGITCHYIGDEWKMKSICLTTMPLEQWCQTDPVKGHVAAGFHSNQARIHLIRIRCVSFQPSKNTADLDQVCCCLVGMKTCSHSGPLLDQFDTTALEERHLASNIAEWLEEVVVRFEIPPSKTIAIVHNNGVNIVAAAKVLEEKHGWSSVRWIRLRH